jgi:hypothetical protein
MGKSCAKSSTQPPSCHELLQMVNGPEMRGTLRDVKRLLAHRAKEPGENGGNKHWITISK